MSLQNQQQLENTQKKLSELKQLYGKYQSQPADNEQVREQTLLSLKRLLNQLQEEIARYQAQKSLV